MISPYTQKTSRELRMQPRSWKPKTWSCRRPQTRQGHQVCKFIVEDSEELEQGHLRIASKGAEEAGIPVHKGEKGNYQKWGRHKRKPSERRENLLISQWKQEEMLLTRIGCGLSKLIEDEETPLTILGSLKVLKHYTTFSSEEKDAPSQKKRKKLPKMPKVK